MIREDIIKKAYQCIDEVYPDSTNQDISAFNIDTFLDQAAKIIVKIVPVRALGAGVDIRDVEGTRLARFNEGIGRIELPQNFQRLISFKIVDWRYPLTEALDESSLRMQQQYNPILRGTPSRPVVFLLQGGKFLEYYTSTITPTAEGVFSSWIDTFQGLVFDKVDDNYPTKLSDITAWKTAELVLSAMNDVTAAQICQTKTQEILQTL